MAKPKPSSRNLAGPLRYAASSGNLKRVRELLAQGAIPNQRATGQPTPLIAASSAGHVRVVKELLAAGADASFAHGGKRGTTALLEAIRYHHFDVAHALIAAGANVHHDWSGEGQTITYEAANVCNKLYRSGKVQDRRKSRASLAIVAELLRAGGKTKIDSATQAATGGNTSLVRVFLAAGFDINERDDGSTMFSRAAYNAHEDLAVELLERGADPWADDAMFGAVLHQAVVEGLTKIVRGIIAAKADLNRRDNVIIGEAPPPTLIEDKDARGNVVGREWKFDSSPKAREATALIVAVRVGKLNMVRLLIDNGADLEATDADGFTALAWAQKLKREDIARALRQAGAKEPAHLEGSPLHALVNAATTGDLDRVKAALLQGADVNGTYFSGRERYTALMCAAEHGHVPVVDELLKAGANPDLHGINSSFKAGITPLILAARGGHKEIVERLVCAGARTDIQQVDLLSVVFGPKSQRDRPLDAAIHEAAAGGHMEIVKLLMNAGAQPRSATSGTVLEAAAASGDKETVAAALAASPQQRNRPTIQALIAAVESRSIETVHMLISAGADVNIRTRQGHTPLASAAMNGDTEMVKLLLKAGGKPSKALAKTIMTELMYAASGGYSDIVSMLLEAGANADEQTTDGETALHWAAAGGHIDAIETLVHAGACPEIRNDEGVTPLQTARQIISAWTGRNKHPFAKLTNLENYKRCVTFLQAAEKGERKV